MADKITLRLKSDPSIVLPEARLMAQYDDRYTLDFANDASLDVAKVAFYKRDWEPVPPPYVLPTGVGAVVRDSTGRKWVRVEFGFGDESTEWRAPAGIWSSSTNLLTLGSLTPLSEGVEA